MMALTKTVLSEEQINKSIEKERKEITFCKLVTFHGIDSVLNYLILRSNPQNRNLCKVKKVFLAFSGTETPKLPTNRFAAENANFCRPTASSIPIGCL